jgi:hypothetical protein
MISKKEKIMAIKFRVYKQLLLDTERIWVAKLDEDDIVDEFDTLEEAEQFASEAQQLDLTGRKYRVQQIEIADEVGE